MQQFSLDHTAHTDHITHMARSLNTQPPDAKIHRISIDVTEEFANQLKTAIIRRAASNRSKTGIEPNVSITAWFKEKARETINEFNK